MVIFLKYISNKVPQENLLLSEIHPYWNLAGGKPPVENMISENEDLSNDRITSTLSSGFSISGLVDPSVQHQYPSPPRTEGWRTILKTTSLAIEIPQQFSLGCWRRQNSKAKEHGRSETKCFSVSLLGFWFKFSPANLSPSLSFLFFFSPTGIFIFRAVKSRSWTSWSKSLLYSMQWGRGGLTFENIGALTCKFKKSKG